VIDYGLVFVTGLLTSFHCIGMCGPIVLAYSLIKPDDNSQTGRSSSFFLHTAYNGGRIISYTLLGALFGLIGMAVGGLKEFSAYFSLICGIIMIVAGIGLLGLFPVPGTSSLGKASGIFSKLHSIFIKKRTIASKLLLGLLTPLLPCGILYVMFVKAASAGSIVGGAFTMFLFSIGMAPSLILVGTLSSFFSARVRKRAELFATIAIIILGISLVLRGLHVPYLRWIPGMHVGGGHGH